jgi:hypothetical protein
VQASEDAKRLIDGLAPYWAGEAEVFRNYWGSGKRTRETDRRWLALQCWKEIWGSGLARTSEGLFLGAARELVAAFPRIDAPLDRREVLGWIDGLREEFAHYCAFADVHDALAIAGEPRLAPRDLVGWEEDRQLAELRLGHKRENPALGERAARITEGGFCTLFASGMGLAGVTEGPHARANALIAAACRGVYLDEFEHMRAGLVGLDAAALSRVDWLTLERMATAQARSRISMRNAQFGYPLAGAALEAALAGRLPPLAGASAAEMSLTPVGATA